jgi:hypothetical protein
MIVYKNYVTFTVMGKEINLMSEDLEHYRNTVAEVDGQYHYMGPEGNSIATAIFAWQEVNGMELTNEELKQTMIDNHLISQGI